jgi:hypothetical protein
MTSRAGGGRWGVAALEELRLARAARNATSNSAPNAPLTPTPPDRERTSSVHAAGNHLEVLHSVPLPPALPPPLFWGVGGTCALHPPTQTRTALRTLGRTHTAFRAKRALGSVTVRGVVV